jgi:hypothetical protein
MSNKNPQPSDAPRVQIETTGLFGQPTVKQIQLDTNRLQVKTESLQRFSNAIAIPSRGMWADALLWILWIAVLIRLPLSLAISQVLPPWGLGLTLAIVAAPVLFALVSVWTSVPDQRVDCFYRFCLINAAVLLATRCFWLV